MNVSCLQYDSKCVEGSLNRKTYLYSLKRDIDSYNLKFQSVNNTESKSLLSTGKRKVLKEGASSVLNINDNVHEPYTAKNFFENDCTNKERNDDNTLEEKTKVFKNHNQDKSEDDLWLNINNVLKNPEFRFSYSNSLDSVGNESTGFINSNHLANMTESSASNGSIKVIISQSVCDSYKNRKLFLNLRTKEIIQTT